MALDTPAVKTTPERPAPEFPIISKQISTYEGEDGRRRFRLTASSTIEDRAGDEITQPALEGAARMFRDGITIYTDHDFRNVNKAFGLTDHAEVIQRGLDPKTGKPIYDLDIEGVVNVPNPNMVQLADSIDGGFVKFGASITAYVRKHSKKRNGGMLISEIEPIEASLVGVPENQRSWALRAALAVKSFHKPDWLNEEETVAEDETQEAGDGTEVISKEAMSASTRNGLSDSDFACPEQRKYPINDAAHVRAALSRVADPSNDQCGREKIIAAARRMGIGEHSKSLDLSSDDALVKWAQAEFPADGITADADGHEVYIISKSVDEVAETEPTEEANGEHSTDEVEDSSDGQASADEAETPETASAVADDAEAETPSVEKAASVVTDAEVMELVKFAKSAAIEIEALRTERNALVEKVAKLEGERGKLHEEVGQATAVISKVLDMPLRSQTAGFVETFVTGHEMFDPRVTDYLNKRSKLNE